MSFLAHLGAGISVFFISLASFFGFHIPSSSVPTITTMPSLQTTTTNNVPVGTLRFIPDIQGNDSGYSTNGQSIYCDGKPLPGADMKTFVPIWSSVANGNYPYRYAKDDAHVYYNCEVVPQADPATFVSIFMNEPDGDYTNYSKDKNYVFHDSPGVAPTIVVGADPTTFQSVALSDQPFESCGTNCMFDAQDKNHKYYQGKIVQ